LKTLDAVIYFFIEKVTHILRNSDKKTTGLNQWLLTLHASQIILMEPFLIKNLEQESMFYL